MIDPEFFELMPTWVKVERYTGQDTVGNDTFGPGIEVRARVEPVTRSVQVQTVQNGTQWSKVQIGSQLIMDLTEPAFKERDRVTFDGQTLRVEAAVIEYDENGPYYQSLQVRNNQPQ